MRWTFVMLAGALMLGACGSNANDDPDSGTISTNFDGGGGDPVDPGDPSCVTPTASASCPGGFCKVPAGCFLMGSSAMEDCRDDDEVRHPVTLTRSFEIGAREVTQSEFQSVMGFNPAKLVDCGGNCPVESVSWHLAAAYANALSQRQGLELCYTCSGAGAAARCSAGSFNGKAIYNCKGYRLPTEAEWEHAYRAGTRTALYNGGVDSCWGEAAGAGKIGWYKQNSEGSVHPVGTKQANAWGIFDMAGNLEEWVHDGYVPYSSSAVTDPASPISEDKASYRGGSWFLYVKDLRAADRNTAPATQADESIGFRVARTL